MSETPTTAKHVHGEAFRLMTYRSDDGTEAESIWNSRDGVTPFVITLRSGKQATHVNWSDDRYAPDHKPKPGDRIFVDITQERAREAAQRNAREWWDGNVAGAQQAYESAEALADMLVADYFQPGAPDLIEVPAEPAVVTGPDSEGLPGAELIAAERHRQVDVEGWTPEHDRRNTRGQLAWAAVCYAAPGRIYEGRVTGRPEMPYEFIDPWPREWSDGLHRGEGGMVPWRRSEGDRVRQLVKAGALIAAEIDRLQAAEGAVMTEQSPVVPSVGAVPVEVPEEAVEAAARALSLCTAADAGLDVFARLAVEAAYPLIAARARAEGEQQFAEAERILEQAIRERDEAEEWADKLAAALAGDAAGEHSSANNPWQNALDIAAGHDARVRAEERQRILGELARAAAHPFKGPNDTDSSMLIDAAKRIEGGYVAGGSHTSETTGRVLRLVAELLAAGSAVPVATPQMVADAETLRDLAPADSVMGDAMCEIADRLDTAGVATPTKPGRQLRVMDAHRLEDCGDRAACWYVAHRAGLCTVVAEQDGQR